MEEKEHITIAICDDETVYGERVRNECIKFFEEYDSQGSFAVEPQIACFSSGRELIGHIRSSKVPVSRHMLR